MFSLKINALFKFFIASISLLFLSSISFAKTVGEITTEWKMIGNNHRIVIETIEDKDVGVVCYLSYAKAGGLSEVVNLEEDTSDNGLSCHLNYQSLNQNLKIQENDLNDPLKRKATLINILDLQQKYLTSEEKENGVQIFKKDSSLFFKKMKLTRFYDNENQSLVYVAHSRRLIAGSPKHSLSVVKIE